MSGEIDIAELGRMIQAKRGKLGLRAAAEQIKDISASTLSRVEQGKIPDLDTFIRICKWLGVSADHFTLNLDRDIKFEQQKPEEVIVAHLRADRTLDPETASMLVKMIQIAYDAVDHGRLGEPKG